VLLGAGAAGIAVGSVFGALALGTKSTLDTRCPTKTSCPATEKNDIDTLGSQSWISNIGFAVGVAGAATGVVLLLVSHGGGEKPAARGTHVAPWVGLGGAGLGGTFE
jgi:hypothetical protein